MLSTIEHKIAPCFWHSPSVHLSYLESLESLAKVFGKDKRESTKVFGWYLLVALLGRCMRGLGCSLGEKVQEL